MEERNTRRVLVGTVVSATNDKTITVLVEESKTHPIYGKRVKSSKKFAAHDENNQFKVGDIVSIVESKPYSKTKTWTVISNNENA